MDRQQEDRAGLRPFAACKRARQEAFSIPHVPSELGLPRQMDLASLKRGYAQLSPAQRGEFDAWARSLKELHRKL